MARHPGRFCGRVPHALARASPRTLQLGLGELRAGDRSHRHRGARPHPPGYRGYVLAARAINSIVHDANTSLVAWNILGTALSALVLTSFAWHSGGGGADRNRTALASAAILLTSPLLWFYSVVAEISTRLSCSWRCWSRTAPGGLVAWALFDRKLPSGIEWRLASLWLLPWLLVFFEPVS